jgi:DNA-binding beta-propeller fold protein YncE
MIRRSSCLLALVGILSLLLLPALAQDAAQRYESAALGVAFDLPGGWQVDEGEGKLLAAAPADLPVVEQGGSPSGLAVRMTFGTFNQLGITDATQLPGLLARLVPSEVAAPPAEPVQWGNASGYQVQVVMPNEGLTTRVALLAIAGGRVAIVRGFAPSAVWDGGAGAQFDAFAHTLSFSLPKRDENYMENIVYNDGGVLWQFLSSQPSSGRVVTAGGITFDEFGVMYMVVGPGGILALEQNTGYDISYMGPWYDGNFVDVAIGPKDLKLYLANIKEDTDQAITVVDRAGNWDRAWGSRGDGDGQFAPGMPRTLAVTRDGSVWTVSEGHASGIRSRLYRFDLYGNLLQTVDLATINPDLSGVRLDANPRTGALYLVGATGNLNVLDSNGEPLVVNLAAEILQGLTPVDIAIAPDDNMILALPAPGLDGYGFVELSVAGKLLDVFGFPYDTARGGPFLPGEYLNPAGLIVGPDGSSYWTETNPANGYVQVQRFVFTGDGKLPLGTETTAGAGSSELFGSSDPAKGGGSIVYGQTVRGSLNNRYPSHRWTFEGRTGDHVIVTMIDASGAGLLDPSLSLQLADGRVIAANDDVGDIHPDGMSTRDARIDFFLPGDGLFIIEAGRFGGRGDYTLSLELVTP